MKRLNIGLDDKTQIKLKLISITEGKPVSSIIREAIMKFFGEYKWDIRNMPEDILKVWLDMMPNEDMTADDEKKIINAMSDKLIPDDEVEI